MTKTAAPPAVVVRGLSKAYGSVRAVDGIDLTVERGEAIAMLGPNGAGKSTIINVMLGLLTPDQGTVTVLGRTPEQAMRAGLLGAMPQEGDLVPRVSVRELIGFVRRTYPRPMPLDEVLEIAGLTGIAGRRVSRLSGGQAQRVRFALALVGDPDLVVLDEPTAALDVESRHELWTAIRAYLGGGKSVIFSTHYLQEVDENADRVMVSRTDNPGDNHSLAVVQLVSAAAFGALGVAVNSCTSIAEDRSKGWLRQLRLTPVQVVLGRCVCALAVVILPILAVGIVGAAWSGVTMSFAGWLSSALVLWLAVTPIALLGARHCAIRIEPDGDLTLLEIADDGIGCADATEGNGLRGLSERLDLADGTVELTPRPAEAAA